MLAFLKCCVLLDLSAVCDLCKHTCCAGTNKAHMNAHTHNPSIAWAQVYKGSMSTFQQRHNIVYLDSAGRLVWHLKGIIPHEYSVFL